MIDREGLRRLAIRLRYAYDAFRATGDPEAFTYLEPEDESEPPEDTEVHINLDADFEYEEDLDEDDDEDDDLPTVMTSGFPGGHPVIFGGQCFRQGQPIGMGIPDRLPLMKGHSPIPDYVRLIVGEGQPVMQQAEYTTVPVSTPGPDTYLAVFEAVDWNRVLMQVLWLWQDGCYVVQGIPTPMIEAGTQLSLGFRAYAEPAGPGGPSWAGA